MLSCIKGFLRQNFGIFAVLNKLLPLPIWDRYLTMLIKQPKKTNDGDNPVRMIQGAPVPLEIYEEFKKRFNIKITEAYGSTEVGLAMVNRAETFRKGSCGKAVSFMK